MQNSRIVFLDYLRVFACFLVVLVHSSENFYAADASGLAGNVSLLLTEQNRLWVSIYDGFSRMAVPLFMMVSAYLLAPMPLGLTMGQFYRRRFQRVVPPLVVFMLLYALLPLLWGGMSWEQAVADLKGLPFNFPSMAGHLWFMYPLISLYFIIPVLSPWLREASAHEERVFLGLWAVSTLMPFLHRWVQPEVWGECFWNEFHMLWYCSGFLGYLVMAHYVRFHLSWAASRRLWVGAGCVLVGAACTIVSFYVQGVPGRVIETPVLEIGWRFCTPNVAVLTFGTFLLFSCIRAPKGPRWVTELSRLSFGIYLIHLFFLNLWAGILIQGHPETPCLPVCLTIPLMALLAFVSSALAVKILSLLPGSKWLVGA